MIRLEPTINGKAFSVFGGAALAGYTVGGTEISNYVHVGVNRSNWAHLKSIYGLRSVRISVKFSGANIAEASLRKSLFDAELFTKADLWLPDGFYYSVYMEGTADAVIDADTEKGALIGAEYSLRGIRHGAMETKQIPAGGGSFVCSSTMPFTDCIYTATMTASAAQYTLGGAVFNNVTSGEVLTFDGINKRILRNGVDAALNVSWTSFPSLVPGLNTVTGTAATTVSYYPAFI